MAIFCEQLDHFFIKECIGNSVAYYEEPNDDEVGYNSKLKVISCFDACVHNGDMTVTKSSTFVCYVYFKLYGPCCLI